MAGKISESEGEKEGGAIEHTKAIREIIKYIQHVAGTLRIHRRRVVAAAMDLVPGSESHYKIGSFDDSQLFGPELRTALEGERRAVCDP